MPASSLLRVEQARVLFALGREADANRDLDTVLSADPGFMEDLGAALPARAHPERGQRRPSRQSREDEPEEGHPTAAGAWLWLGLHQRKAGGKTRPSTPCARQPSWLPATTRYGARTGRSSGRAAKWQAVLDDAATLEMTSRAWTVRWNEAEALSALGRRGRGACGLRRAQRRRIIAHEIHRAKRAATRVSRPSLADDSFGLNLDAPSRSSKPATITIVAAGRMSAKRAPWARPTAAASSARTRYVRVRTMSSRLAPRLRRARAASMMSKRRPSPEPPRRRGRSHGARWARSRHQDAIADAHRAAESDGTARREIQSRCGSCSWRERMRSAPSRQTLCGPPPRQ